MYIWACPSNIILILTPSILHSDKKVNTFLFLYCLNSLPDQEPGRIPVKESCVFFFVFFLGLSFVSTPKQLCHLTILDSKHYGFVFVLSVSYDNVINFIAKEDTKWEWSNDPTVGKQIHS